jgi:FMN phosphatase YigB (HAD superfamily)
MMSMFGRLREVYSVHPQISQAVVDEVAAIVGTDGGDQVERAKAEMRKIYEEIVPELLPGAVEGIELALAIDLKVAVFSHSEIDWMGRKIMGSGIEEMFEWFAYTSSKGNKGSEEWKEAIKQWGYQPSQVMVWGNSLGSDIWPAIEAGVPATQVFYVLSTVEHGNDGEIPKGVRMVRSLIDVGEVLRLEGW